MSATCNVQKYGKNENGRIEYFIKVFYNGREWGIWKRFSDFVRFDEFLKKNGIFTTYKLPARNWWNRYDPDLLNMRLKELQIYMDVLLKSTVNTGNSLVKEFLEVDDNLLQDAIKQSTNPVGLNQLDRAKDILKETRLGLIQIPSTLSNKNKSKNENSPTSTSLTKKISFSRGPSLGSALSRAPSFTSWNSKRPDSRDAVSKEVTTKEVTTKEMTRESSRFQSIEFLRTMSFGSNTALYLSDSHTTTVADIVKIESFLRHTSNIYQKESVFIDQAVQTLIPNQLPNSIWSDNDAIQSLSLPPNKLISILHNITNDVVNRVIEVSPKTVLTFQGAQLIQNFRPPPSNFNMMSESPMLQRNKSIVKENSISFEDSSEMSTSPEDVIRRKPRTDLRLRKTPSEIAKRNGFM